MKCWKNTYQFVGVSKGLVDFTDRHERTLQIFFLDFSSIIFHIQKAPEVSSTLQLYEH